MRCRRTYLGHLTKRVRSRFGWMSPPRRKLRGVFSKSGFFWVRFFFSARGAEGSFFLPAAAFAALPMALRWEWLDTRWGRRGGGDLVAL